MENKWAQWSIWQNYERKIKTKNKGRQEKTNNYKEKKILGKVGAT